MNKLSLFTMPALIFVSCFIHASSPAAGISGDKAPPVNESVSRVARRVVHLPSGFNPQSYIDFGTQAYTNVAPFNAIVEVQAGRNLCTGTQIDPQTVLTAGHCVFSEYGTQRQPGEMSVSRKKGGWDSEIYHVTAIHTQYNPRGLEYDVAILKIDNKDKNVPTIPVAPAYLTREWLSSKAPELIIAGYGIDRNKNYQLPGFLQTGRTQLMRDRYARDTLIQIEKDYNFHATFDPKHNFATCSHQVVDHGDSGGPVFYKDPRGNFYLIGNTSWGMTERRVDENYQPVFISYNGCFDNSGKYHKDRDAAFFTDLTHDSINNNFVASLLMYTRDDLKHKRSNTNSSF